MNTQRGFGHITVDGVEYPVRFSLNQTQIFCELEKCDLKGYNDLFAFYPTGEKDEEGKPKYANRFSEQKVTPDTLRHLLYSALKEGHRVSKKEFTLSMEDVGDMLELMETDSLAWRNILHLIVKKEEAPRPNDNPK
ncbi:SAM domain-containing protein [Rufibacter roseus]|uniref:Uncharacterized protein n=1 Tax=Rufibacter roseus TaxID=1567108 RepID=A0ABW2DND1_9BACT|nr:hypothetical protein [Rufibacter roseus]